VHDGSGRCAAHVHEPWVKRPQAAKRIRGRKLQALRAALFRAAPLCAECERQGRVALATQRDHIRALEEGGTDTEDNVQGLCTACHEAKSQAEAQRGRRA
jgi:5-methylcytosine-specific restriction protein A